MSTQDSLTNNGGTNGPDTHGHTKPEPDAEHTVSDADAHQDLLAVTDQVAPNWYADKVAHPHRDAHQDEDDAAEPHPDAHPAADGGPAVGPGDADVDAADRSAAELSAEQLAAFGRAAVGASAALNEFGNALLDCIVAARHLAAVLGTVPNLRDSKLAESANDAGAGGGEPTEPAGWDWGTSRD